MVRIEERQQCSKESAEEMVGVWALRGGEIRRGMAHRQERPCDRSDELEAPEVVEVDDAEEATGVVDYDDRGNFALLHEC
jgi:hypothetical protein